MTYLTAASLLCAQGSRIDAGALRPPERIALPFLGEVKHLPYYRAFAQDYLDEAGSAAHAAAQIDAVLAHTGWTQAELSDTPLYIGSTAYTAADAEIRRSRGEILANYTLARLGAGLAARYGFAETVSFASSCTSSAHALMHAHRAIQSGQYCRALVLGIENRNRLTLAHFNSCGLLAEHYQPFGGSGFILGETAACLALEAAPRSGMSLQLAAAAANTDTAGLTELTADSLIRLFDALPLENIDIIKAHGVGSQASDAAEAAAYAAAGLAHLPMLCCKPYIGHTLGASTALETALLWQILQARHADAILTRDRAQVDLPASGSVLSLSLGFGGNNTAAVWTWKHPDA